MNIFEKFVFNTKSIESKIERLNDCENKLKELSIIKDDLLDKYTEFNKALNSEDFECKSELEQKKDSFETSYICDLSSIKLQEKNIKKDKESILKNIDVQNYFKEQNILKSIKEIKMLYKSRKINLGIYNEIIKSYTKNKVTKYADVCVLNNKGQLLLLKRSQFEDANKGAWVIPGGHVDINESFEDAAKRELLEESGISYQNLTSTDNNLPITWYKLGEYKDEAAHIEYYCLHLGLNNPEILLDEAETRDYKWINPDELEDYEMVFNMRENISKMLGWEAYPQIRIIKKAVLDGIIDLKHLPEISKAIHKYIRKESDGKGGFNYIYEEPNNTPSKQEDNKQEDIKLITDSDQKIKFLQDIEFIESGETKIDKDYDPEDPEYNQRKVYVPVYVNKWDYAENTDPDIEKFEDINDAVADLSVAGDYSEVSEYYEPIKRMDLMLKEAWVDSNNNIVDEEDKLIGYEKFAYENKNNPIVKRLGTDQIIDVVSFDSRESDARSLENDVFVNINKNIIKKYKELDIISEQKGKYRNIKIRKDGENIGNIQLRISNHSYNPANNDDNAKNGNFISVEIANKNETKDRFNGKYGLQFNGKDTYKDVVDSVNERIKEILEDRYSDGIVKSIESKNELKGGKADGMTLEDIAKYHKVELSDLKKEHNLGIKIEREHTDSDEKANEITLDHLFESPTYYSESSQKDWAKKELENESIKKAFTDISNLYLTDQISEDVYLLAEESYIQKAWKAADLGEIRTRSDGSKWRKVSATGDKKKDWEQVKADKDKKQEDNTEKLSTAELSEYAKNTSETALQNAIKQSKDEDVRNAAKEELNRRSEEEGVKTNNSIDVPKGNPYIEKFKYLSDFQIEVYLNAPYNDVKEAAKFIANERGLNILSKEDYIKQFEDWSEKDINKITKEYNNESKGIKEFLSKNENINKSLSHYVKYSGYETIRSLNSGGEDGLIQELKIQYGRLIDSKDFLEKKINQNKESNDNLTRLINENKLNKNLVLNRRVNEKNKFFSLLNVGDVYEDKSFSSTSLIDLKSFGNFNIKILAKKGSNVSNIDNKHEFEYLIDKNSKFRVIEKREDGLGITVELL